MEFLSLAVSKLLVRYCFSNSITVGESNSVNGIDVFYKGLDKREDIWCNTCSSQAYLREFIHEHFQFVHVTVSVSLLLWFIRKQP